MCSRMAPMLGTRVHCSGSPQLRNTVQYIVHSLGGSYSMLLSSSCTHVVASEMTHTVKVCRSYYPEIPVVHPRWLTKCWTARTLVSIDLHTLFYVLDTRRTGTSTRCGSLLQFYTELPRFLHVEREVRHNVPSNIALPPRWLANFIGGPIEVRSCTLTWKLVWQQLGDTIFWGFQLRQLNWEARRVYLMALLRATKETSRLTQRKRMRTVADGPVLALKRLAFLPIELWPAVLTYL